MGTVSVLTAVQSRMWFNTLPITAIGGTSQLLSKDQSWQKASTASVPGCRNLELNLGNVYYNNTQTSLWNEDPKDHPGEKKRREQNNHRNL